MVLLLWYIQPVYHEVQCDQGNLGQNDPVTRIRRARLGSLPKPPSLQQPIDQLINELASKSVGPQHPSLSSAQRLSGGWLIINLPISFIIIPPKGSDLALLHPKVISRAFLIAKALLIAKVISESAFNIKSAFDTKSDIGSVVSENDISSLCETMILYALKS